MVIGMTMFSFEHDNVCRGCALGKNTNKSYPHNNRKSNGILDLIHSDFCGAMVAPSMNGCLYYIIFIDDCCWHRGRPRVQLQEHTNKP
jgi:hypothetical protein